MSDETVIGFDYTEKQLEILYTPTDAKYIIITKGRRAGITKAYQQAFIEWALDGISPMLWVDTVNGNIDRYFERYFQPDLKKIEPNYDWNWNQQKKILNINGSIIDFRSAESPENIEGFGYKKIFLNEAGIILKDDSLYTMSILPMLIDFPDSQLIAAGVPKGKFKKDGNKHKFFELYENTLTGNPRYKHYHCTGYDNDFINAIEIDEMRKDMTDAEADQEIFGQFVEFAGNNPFFHQYKKEKHEATDKEIEQGICVFNPSRQITMSIDFNLNPFALTFSHIWEDKFGIHDHQFDEIEIPQGSISKMINEILLRYGRWIQGAQLTGDAMGKKEELSQSDNASLYTQLIRGLGMAPSQLKVTSNPNHGAKGTNRNSRSDCNYVLLHHPDFKINPKKCPVTCREMIGTQCNAFGEIIKRDRKNLNQRADFSDTVRYKINTFHRDWIDKHSKHHR